jgi:hypothetical protein
MTEQYYSVVALMGDGTSRKRAHIIGAAVQAATQEEAGRVAQANARSHAAKIRFHGGVVVYVLSCWVSQADAMKAAQVGADMLARKTPGTKDWQDTYRLNV